MCLVKKVIGADFELANTILSASPVRNRAGEAAARLLAEIPGYPQGRAGRGTSIEMDRRFLAGSGGSAYIDSDHLEINTPEHCAARDHMLHVHAGFHIARQAQLAAARNLPPGMTLAVWANNSDGLVSYGRHLNVLTTNRCFQDILYRKPHQAGFLATHLVTSVLYTGQGMVGAANGRSPCEFQLSQRADWFECFTSHDTMQRRPLLNLRDEPHATDGLARLHLIYYDTVLCPVANWLQAGTTQLVVAMCEAGWVAPDLQLDDPIGAASRISRDLTVQERLPTSVRGRSASALELQWELARRAGEFVDSGEPGQAIPDADQIVSLWMDTLEQLKRREFAALAGRCDNWMKYLLLDRHRGRRQWSWGSPEMKLLDLRFSSLDPAEGLFLQLAQAGTVEAMPSDDEIRLAADQPPDDTRAYLRAEILRRYGEAVSRMDWGWIEFRIPSSRGWWSTASLALGDPRSHTKADCQSWIESCPSLDEFVAEFGIHRDRNRRIHEETQHETVFPVGTDSSPLL